MIGTEGSVALALPTRHIPRYVDWRRNLCVRALIFRLKFIRDYPVVFNGRANSYIRRIALCVVIGIIVRRTNGNFLGDFFSVFQFFPFARRDERTPPNFRWQTNDPKFIVALDYMCAWSAWPGAHSN